MCLACEQDSIWLAYLESRGLLRPDDPAAVDALFGAFPVQPLPVQGEEAGRQAPQRETSRELKAEKNPFSCDDPTAE
jgi:hypothetical protein